MFAYMSFRVNVETSLLKPSSRMLNLYLKFHLRVGKGKRLVCVFRRKKYFTSFLVLSVFINLCSGAGELAQGTISWLCKHDDLRLDPQNSSQSQKALEATCNPSTGDLWIKLSSWSRQNQ